MFYWNDYLGVIVYSEQGCRDAKGKGCRVRFVVIIIHANILSMYLTRLCQWKFRLKLRGQVRCTCRWIGGEMGVISHVRSASFALLLGFHRPLPYSSLLPAQWTASVRDTGALLVHSPHNRDGFSAAPNLYLNSIETSGHSSLVCSHVPV